MRRVKRHSANGQIQRAIIGAGRMGTIDVNTALDIEGVKLAAVCDLYGGRLEKATVAKRGQGGFAILRHLSGSRRQPRTISRL